MARAIEMRVCEECTEVTEHFTEDEYGFTVCDDCLYDVICYGRCEECNTILGENQECPSCVMDD